MGPTMAKGKTSAEQAREDAEQSQLDNMLGHAFGDITALEKSEPVQSDDTSEQVSDAPATQEEQPTVDLLSTPLSTPSRGPPSGPPKGPPSGPPSGSPSGPPKGPPSGPPSGPPKGPPSGTPPNSTTTTSATEPALESTEDISDDTASEGSVAEDAPLNSGPDATSDDGEEPNIEVLEIEQHVEIAQTQNPVEIAEVQTESSGKFAKDDILLTTPLPKSSHASSDATTVLPNEVALGSEQQADFAKKEVEILAEKDAELERLHMENARLRQSVVGATEVIEQMEEPNMPPLVEGNIVIAPHIVSDFVRIGRQLDREHLVRATMGTVAMLHPEQPGLMISSRHMAVLPRLNERSLCLGYLGNPAPRGAPSDWRALEVVLASVSMVTGGPAAVIHMHGVHTTAASCEQDLVLLTPIDEYGKRHIGKIIIVDTNHDDIDDFLRQVAAALQQGGMRCVVIRGNGAYAVGADFDQAWANAAMLEHSMQIHLLARQARLKI